MACTSGCRTQEHKSWGECVRAKGVSTKAGETTKASFPARTKKENK
jgi:hypothetical protein